jgi:predicted nuclease of predicted toxin-antitoxin system
MRFLIDMNLSPRWCAVYQAVGWTADHWSTIGAFDATDHEIMQWTAAHDCIVFTHDLDFGAILAATGTNGPSVIQVRCQDVFPETLGTRVVATVRSHQASLVAGALMVIDDQRARVRILPLRQIDE